jgi:hypothetical protein
MSGPDANFLLILAVRLILTEGTFDILLRIFVYLFFTDVPCPD